MSNEIQDVFSTDEGRAIVDEFLARPIISPLALPRRPLEKHALLRVERIAYREHEQSQWNWYGPVIRFMASGYADNWRASHMELEKLCQELVKKYPTIEEYVDNVTRIHAPSEKSLALYDVHELSKDRA